MTHSPLTINAGDSQLTLREVRPNTRELEAIMALWRRNSATLGFFPRGAFDDHARRGQILSCFVDSELAGYTAYRIVDRWACIIHLCVDFRSRGQGIARVLIDELAKRTQTLDGIKLHCRRDFDVNHIWPRLGFYSVEEKAGRGRKPKALDRWVRPNHHADLFSLQHPEARAESGRIAAVVDANVFFSLTNPELASEETQALTADWLADFVTLQVTEEIFNEIKRNSNQIARKYAIESAQAMGIRPCKPADFQSAFERIRPVFPVSLSDSDESDVRQVARAIGSRADVFLTFDEGVLARADKIYAAGQGLRVMRPAEFIVDLDSVIRETEYRPSRYRETRLERRRVSDDADELAATFVRSDIGEKQRKLAATIRGLLSSPQVVNVDVVRDESGPLGIVAINRREASRLDIALLRTRTGPLSGTLSRSFVMDAIRDAAAEHRYLVTVSDAFPSRALEATLEELDFSRAADAWNRVVLPGCKRLGDLERVAAESTQLDAATRQSLHETLTRARARSIDQPHQFAAALERALWPLKLEDAELPAYVVSIQRSWAERLLDPRIGAPSLFPHRDIDGMRLEGVFYSGTTLPMSAPARILWYVSRAGAMCAWACSLLEEVVVDEPKPLFRRFRRLGVYEWRDVEASVRRDGRVVALRFSGTEVFSRPVSRADLRRLLPEASRANFAGPVQISAESFLKIYKAAH